MAQTYKPGETVPKTGEVRCSQRNGLREKVVEGDKFAPCLHWREHGGWKCTWEYV
jgi:hypothetical protein